MTIMQEYWDERYRKQKDLTVGHVSFDKKKFESVTRTSHEFMFNHVRPHLVGKKILDFGCGVGRHTEVLGDLAGDKGRVCGVDINKWAIAKAAQHSVFEFKLYDGITIPFRGSSFDVVFTWTVLQHIPNDELVKTIEEFHRVLRRGGYLIAYENTTKKKDASHIWFRSVDRYSILMTTVGFMLREKTHVVSNMDGTGEEHSLMFFKMLE